MTRKPFLTVYGHVTVDQIVSVRKFPTINETVDITSKRTSLGGTGTNIAITAARLGVPTALAAFVGPDFPERYMRLMKESGLITDEVFTVEDYETSQATVINDEGLRQKVIFYQGPQGFATKIGKDLIKEARASERVHFCTGEPAYYLHIMDELGNDGPLIAADPSQETYRLWTEDILKKALRSCDCLFCNSYEAKVIEERMHIASVLDLDKVLVVRTDGAEGSVAKVDGEVVKVPCIKGARTVDATGCGDTYRAGFYSGLYHGYSPKESLILASATASFTIEKVGALTNTPTWDMVEERAAPYMRR